MINEMINVLKYIIESRINLWKSPEQLEKLQNKKLRKIIANAYENVPYYKKLFDDNNIKPSDIQTTKDLKKIPITTKKDLKKYGTRKIISKKCKLSELKKYPTAGTLFEPFDVYLSQKEVIERLALELRCFMLAGLKLHDKVMVMGHIFKDSNLWYNKMGLLRRKSLNSFSTVDEQIKLAKQFKPNILRGYPSCLRLFALEYKKRKLDFLHPKVIFTGAELLDEETRHILESTFNTKACDIYGSWEFGRIAFECKAHSGFHLNEDYLVFEFLDTENKDDKEIIITSLISYTMPFIRCKLGDMVELKKGKCRCGLNFRRIKALKGRSLMDYFILQDGTKVSSIHSTTMLRQSVLHPFTQYKVVQHTRKLLEVIYIRDKPLTKKEILKIKAAYKNYVGDVKLKFTKVDKIPLTKGGKFLYFESKIKK